MEFNSSGNKRSLPPSLMPPKLGAFDGFMTTIKKYAKARGSAPLLHFVVKTIIATTSTNKNKKVRSHHQHSIWKQKKIGKFLQGIKGGVCKSIFVGFSSSGASCHIVNKWGNPCP